MKKKLQLCTQIAVELKSRLFFSYPLGIKKIANSIHVLLFVSVSMIAICQPTSPENEINTDETDKTSRNNYLPIINLEQVWTGFYADFSGPFQSYRYSYSEDSVMLGSKYYHARVESGKEDGSNSYVKGHYRESNGKLFKYREGDIEEVIILDMSLILDDTIAVYAQDYQSTLKVTSVDSVQFEDNVWRKRIVLNCLLDPSYYGTMTWVEGFGELISYAPHCALDNFGGEIVCIRNGIDELIYNIVEEKDCWITTSTKELDEQSARIYPNPASDEVFFKGFSDAIEYTIYSLSSQLI